MKDSDRFITFINTQMSRILSILLICMSLVTFVTGQDSEPEKLLNNAIYEEEVNGNLEGAIGLYEEIVNNYPGYRSVVAEALFRNGLANEKLGNLKARQYYEQVINNYSDQPEMVRLASARLNQILKSIDSESVMVDKEVGLTIVNLYDKGANFRNGTMLDNSCLSPDGTRLVGIDYTVGQNVAVYDIRSREIDLITKDDWGNTKDHGWSYFPAWSPDGKQIAYLFSDWNNGKGADYELKVTDLEGESRTLVTNKYGEGQIIPRQWADDGNSILAFVQDSTGFYTISLVSVEDGSVTPLYKTQWIGTFIKGDASLSPDGQFVVFADGPADNMDIFIMDTKGGESLELSAYPTNEKEPLWSPDGKHIAFIKETKGDAFLYTLEIEDGKPIGQSLMKKEGMRNFDLRNWTDQGICCKMGVDMFDIYTLEMDPETNAPAGKPKPVDYAPMGSNSNPVWSHNGKHLAFLSFANEPEVVIMPLEGGTAQNYPISVPGLWELSVPDLRWLPDNSGLSFSAISPTEESTVYRFDIASGEWQEWELQMQGWTRTDWGPDNNSFIYSTYSPSTAIYQFNINTRESYKIFETDTNLWYTIRGLRFSRDYEKLTFLAYTEDYNKVMILDLKSGENKILCENHWSPTFSPDGKNILTFGINGEGDDKSKYINILSLEGEVIHQFNIGQFFSSGTSIYNADWSPDGKQIVFVTREMKDETSLMVNVLE